MFESSHSGSLISFSKLDNYHNPFDDRSRHMTQNLLKSKAIVGTSTSSVYWWFMKLCVLTDIFSYPMQKNCISKLLPQFSEVIHFSLNDLCGRPNLTGELLHQHLFNNGGIEEAVKSLKCKIDCGYFGLGYSAGGTVLWRAAAQGVLLNGLYCVSSTRLRNESAVSVPNMVFFGALDQNIPPIDWLSKTPEQHIILQGASHSYYLDMGSDEVKETAALINHHMSTK